jgi:poly-beta-1,6-N-acetyl-D-glucosamine biosynthesis protein PgaD
MNGPSRPWPPLIVAGQVPRLIKWRDFLLTWLVWVLFAHLLDAEFELFRHYLERFGINHVHKDVNWLFYLEQLTPFLLMAAVLAALIVIFSLRTLRRRRRALLVPQPAPLETSAQAGRAGLDEAALLAARDRRIVVVHIDADGRHRIEAK